MHEAVDHRDVTVHFSVELYAEPDGRWRARLADGPAMEIDGNDREEALLKAKALALRFIAEEAEKSAEPRAFSSVR